MAGDKDTLIDMGFDPARVEWALKATKNSGLQPAMDHLIENSDNPIPEPGAQAGGSAGEPMDEDEEADAAAFGLKVAGADEEAKSIKCSQCGKIFKNTALANFHAQKSGHDQFEESTEEIKPLTEEEKKQRLEELREKMAAKRANKAIEEAKETKANEALRKKTTKDMAAIKEDLANKQAKKEAEAKRREKIEDAKARAAVKAQIEADKKARAAKAAAEKAAREGRIIPEAPSSSAAVAPSKPAAATPGADRKDTRLQIRMANPGGGGPYTTTLPSDSTLRAVAEFVAGQTISVDVETVSFAMHFPRKQFTSADMGKTLRELGLTPSAVLIAS